MDPISFINPQIIERLENGQFVPERQGKPASVTLQDRRDTLSPLAIGKRCIRYEPQVFYHRKDLIIQLAKKFNDPQHKILLVTGPQGIGKTSLTRGLVEMMGGGKEQLLWFDINVHTDFEEITQFLIQYIDYISKSLGIPIDDGHVSPFLKGIPAHVVGGERLALEKLSHSLNQLGDLPLLLVIDNIEYIVDPEYQIQSFAFKEILNFLLSFPNIKMVLMGERMPYSDISVNSDIVTEVKLSSLSEKDSLETLRHLPNTETWPTDLSDLFKKTAGIPWLLSFLKNLQSRDISYTEISQIPIKAGSYFLDALIDYLVPRFSQTELALLSLVTIIRHPIDRKTLLTLIKMTYPELPEQDLYQLIGHLDKSLARSFLKRSFPPQVVLKQVQEQLASQQALQPDPWFDIIHRQAKKYLYARLPEEQKSLAHQALQEIYVNDKAKPEDQRLFKLKVKALMAEATFHSQRSRRRRSNQGGEPSLESKSYLYKSLQEQRPERQLGLEDYRNIKVPDMVDVPPPSGQKGTRPPKPFVNSSRQEESFLSADEQKLIHLELEQELPTVPPQTNPYPETSGSPPPPSRQATSQPAPSAAGEPLTNTSKDSGPLSFQDILNANPTPAAGIPPAKTGRIMEGTLMEPEIAEAAFAPVAARHADGLPIDVVLSENALLTSDRLSNQEDLLAQEGILASDVEKRLEEELAMAIAQRNRPTMIARLIDLARYHLSLRLYPQAETCMQKALSIKQDASAWSMGELHGLMGDLYRKTQRHEKAYDCFLQAVKWFEQAAQNPFPQTASHNSHDPAVREDRIAAVYQQLGELTLVRGLPQESIRYYLQATQHFERSGNPSRQAEVTFKLAELYDQLKLTKSALMYYELTLQLERKQGNHLACATALVNMGSLYLDLGQQERAIKFLLESIAHDRRVENREGQFNTLELLAKIYRQQKEWMLAEDAYLQGLQLALHDNNVFWQATVYLNLGGLAATQGEWAKALQYYQSAETIAGDKLSTKSKAMLKDKIQEAQSHVQP